jgi:alpha-beta hydrolase superfamily lysophospholipase
MRSMLGIAAAIGLASGAAAQTPGEPVTLQARDGVSISGLAYTAEHPKAVVLLFHQAQSSKAEYATIAPRLAAAGFSALSIDQRSGGALYGPNETVARLGKSSGYEAAKPDLEAALDWAKAKHLPVVLWGSSYSAALVFEVAAEHPSEVGAVMAFSPGEYLGSSGTVARAAAHIAVPIYVTSAPAAEEVRAARQGEDAICPGIRRARRLDAHRGA